MSRSKAKYAIRLSIGITLVIVVYASVDMSSLLEVLGRISWQGATLVIGLYVLSQIMSAVKWQILIRNAGINRTLPLVTRAYFFGMFVNTFGLGTVGGDVSRTMLLKPDKGHRVAAVATVVADRIHGLLTLFLMTAVAVFIAPSEPLGSWVYALVAGVASALLASWWLVPALLLRVIAHDHTYGEVVHRVVAAFPLGFRVFSTASIVSVASHSLQVLMHVVIAYDLQSTLDVGYLFVCIPLVNIAASIPVSINGIGVRESMYVVFFAPRGVPAEIAVSFGALWLVAVTIVGAVGGLFFPVDLKDVKIASGAV